MLQKGDTVRLRNVIVTQLQLETSIYWRDIITIFRGKLCKVTAYGGGNLLQIGYGDQTIVMARDWVEKVSVPTCKKCNRDMVKYEKG